MQNRKCRSHFYISHTVVLLFILSGCQTASGFNHSIIVKEDGVKRFKDGEVRYVENIPLLKLRGNYYDMGLQHGVLMKNEIQQFVGEMQGLIDGVIASMPWYKRFFTPFWIKMYTADMKKRLPNYYLDEIKGMSDGTGIDFNKLVFMSMGAGLMDTSGCTSILVRLDDRIIHGRNFDWEPLFLGRYPAIIKYHPEGKKSFTSFLFVGFPGVIHGINEDGLSLSTNIAFGLFNDDNDSKGLPIIFKNREVLENASTIKEAEQIFNRYETDEPGWMIAIASPSESEGAIFDIYDNQIIKSALDKKYIHVHNILFHPERLGSSELSKRYLPVCMGQTEYNLARENTTKQLMEKKGIKNIEDMLAYLGNVNFYEYDDIILTDNGSINNEYTVNTLVFDALNNHVYCSFAPGYSGFAKVFRYDLKKGTLKLYKNEAREANEPEMIECMKWYEEYQAFFYKGQNRKILELTDFSREISPVKLMYIVDAWIKVPDALSPDLLVSSIEKQIKRYSDYGPLYKLKGDVLHVSGADSKAAHAYEQAISAKYMTNEYRLKCLTVLYEIYSADKTMRNKASSIRQKYMDLVDELRKIYHIEEEFEDRYQKMKQF